MIITKELYKTEKRLDGNYPVVIMVSHMNKKRLVNTPVFVKESAWDSATASVSETDSDYKIKNEMIEAIYRRIAGRIQSYLDSMLASGLDELLEHFEKPDSDSADTALRLAELIEMKASHVRTLNTRRGYESFSRYIKRCFPNNPTVESINRKFLNEFRFFVEKDYSDSDTMRRIMISKFNAVLSFGIDNGYISSKVRLALPTKKSLITNRNLTENEIRIIFEAYSDALVKDKRFELPTTEGIALFILDIAFQGLAPVDLANLKVKSLKFVTLHKYELNPRRYEDDDIYRKEYDNPCNKIEAVTLETARKKTGRPVVIVSSILGIGPFLRKLITGKTPEDYLISCYNINKEYTPTQRQDRLANYFYMQAGNLNRALAEYCEEAGIEQMRRVTYYFARHAFCNLVDGMDIPRHLIQSMVGHRSSVLENSYLRPLNPWEQASISHSLLSRFFKP